MPVINTLLLNLINIDFFFLLSLTYFYSDMTKSQNLSKNSPVTPQPEPVAPGPRQHQRRNQQKKKKNNRF